MKLYKVESENVYDMNIHIYQRTIENGKLSKHAKLREEIFSVTSTVKATKLQILVYSPFE